MEQTYFNYTNHRADGWWERRTFLHGWWRIQAGDRRWAPPYYPALRRLLVRQQSGYLASVPAVLFHLEALPRRQRRKDEPGGPHFAGALMEEAVAAAVLYVDPSRTTNVGYLGLLHCVNHQETLERFWAAAQEILLELGCRRVIGRAGLSPGLPMGALQNYFHVSPPLHTPYNSPYLPELLESLFDPVGESDLYHYTLPTAATVTAGVAQIEPFDPARLAGDLLPLFLAGLEQGDELGMPRANEVH
ncbi:MAG TPA: hypothetical protein PKE45_18265, partial [Caldilineaceae bacterium]|nr:hypothetical protein [Caldilineaceae bacterium]